MSALAGFGLSVDPPPGWDAHIYRRPRPEEGTTFPVMHVANFALPPDRGDFGGGAVELMGPDHVLVTLVELDPASAGTALFARLGVPVPLPPGGFGPTTMQRVIAGQAGGQWFFQARGRAFCLYVVLGSHLDRARLVPEVNRVLASIAVDPVPAASRP